MENTGNRQGETAISSVRGSEIRLPQMLTVGLIAAALFLPLFFQDVRLEGYETEKAGVLLMFAAPLLVLIPFIVRRTHLKSPLTWAVLLLIGVSAVSTVTSISPHTSLEGLPNRGQGLLTYLAYGALLFGAAGAGKRLIPLITPILIAVAVPLCLYALYQRFDTSVSNPRPGSLLGNANFFASWLILAALWIGSQIGTSRGISRIISILTLILIGIALILTGSRGALAALAAGAFAMGLAFAIVTGRRRFALGLVGIAIVGALAYGAVMVFVPEIQLSGVLRIFRPVDPFRLDAWAAGATIVDEMGTPLIDAFGSRDPFVMLRAFVGYGLDTIPFLQSRYGVVGSPAYYIDTFHNLGFDALAWTGVIGLLIWIALYLAVATFIYRKLDIYVGAFGWLIHIIGVGIGAGLFVLLIRGGYVTLVVPIMVGGMLGIPLGTILLIGLRTNRENTEPLSDDRRIVIAVLGVLIAGWIDLQFGFMTVSAGSLWWISLGLLLASESHNERSKYEWANPRFAPTRAVASAGIILIAGIGMTMQSQYVRHEVAAPTLIILLAILFILGVVSAFVTDPNPRSLIRNGVIALAVWIAWGILEYGITQIAGARADAALTDSAAVFGESLYFLALKGIGAAGLLILIWLPYDAIHQRIGTAALMFAPMILLMIGGALIYAHQFRISTQIAVGNTFASLGVSDANTIALRLYNEIPDNPQTQFEALNFAWRFERSPYMFNADTERLLQNEPYIIGTRRWTLFYNGFVAQYRQPPAYSLNVIRAGTFDGDNPYQYWTPYADAEILNPFKTLIFTDTGDQPDTSAVVYQDVNMTAAAGTRFDIRLDLRNPSSDPATVHVRLNPPDWSESPFCAFVLPPDSAWRTYTMSAETTIAWENIRFALYSVDGETVDERIEADNIQLRLIPPTDAPSGDSSPECE